LTHRLEEHHVATAQHGQRVRRYALWLADALGLPRDQRRVLGLAAQLHDIGKLCLPVALLDKPGGLSAAEYRRVQQHAILGECLLTRLVPHPEFLRGVRHHHERFDGSGYPDVLVGTDIPFLARILSLADSFDAMTHVRPYRPALTWETAREQMRRQAGRQFDPELAVAFVDTVTAALWEVNMCEQTSGRRAGPPAGDQHEWRRTLGRSSLAEEDAMAVIVSDGQQSRWARAQDLSRRGIGFLVCCPFEPGTTVSIHLRSWTTLLAVDRWADVIYTNPQPNGIWRVGCRFNKPLSAEEIEDFV